MTVLMLILFMNYQNDPTIQKQRNSQYLQPDQMIKGTQKFFSDLSDPITTKAPDLPSLPPP